MEPEYTSSVTLMFLGDDLDPDIVTQNLSLSPSQSWRRGDTKTGGVSTYDRGGWKLCLDQEHKDNLLEEQLLYWCDTLESRIEAIAELKLQGVYCALRVFLVTDETASIILTNAQQIAITRLGLDLELALSIE